MQALLSYGRSIQDFKNKQPKQIFEQASSYPSFFDKHLVHPLRRIKVLHNDPNANIRAFYFQYLMLCFEIENPNYQFYISKIQKFLIDPNFTFLFLEDDDQLIFNDKQFKRFLFQFMEILDSNQYQSTQAALNAYNIADVVFVYFFRSLALYAEITTDFDTYIDKNVLFGFLLENFNIDAQIFQERCIKFIQAEVFVYEESPNQVYLVYKDIEATNSQSNNSKLSNSADHARKLSQSLTQSKKEDKQQVQQNISMLEADLLNSQTNSLHQQNSAVPSIQKSGQPAALLVDSGFKKNKILDTEAAYKKFIQLEQKPSVLSRNQQGIDSHEQIQYSFKNSEQQSDNLHPNNTNMNYSKDLYQNNNYIEKENDNYLYNQNANYHHYGIDKSKDSQDFHHKDEIYSHLASITTGMGLDFKSNQYDIMGGITNKHHNSNNHDYKDLSSRDRTAHSYFDPPQTNLPLSSRNHSSTTVEPTIKNKYPNYTNNEISHHNNNKESNKYGNYQNNFNDYGDYHYNQSINGLNSKLNQVTSHVEKDKYQLNKDYYQYTSFNYHETANTNHGAKSISINASHVHVPPTRDIPSNSHSHHQANTNLNPATISNNTHYHNEYNSSNNNNNSNKYNYDGLSTVSQHTASKQSLTLTTNHQSTPTPKTQQNINSLNEKISRQSTSSFPKKQPSTISSPYPYPNQASQQSSQSITRQMRQDSIPTRQDKQRFRQIISQKLSVSKQFTDSLTLMKMGQPYCSSIKKMKARSRQFRQSIINSFK